MSSSRQSRLQQKRLTELAFAIVGALAKYSIRELQGMHLEVCSHAGPSGAFAIIIRQEINRRRSAELK